MMHSNGLTKLIEECGELVQIAAKCQAFPDVDIHPDGLPLISRLEEEIGDVLAAASFVIQSHNLNTVKICRRRDLKECQYNKWHQLPPS